MCCLGCCFSVCAGQHVYWMSKLLCIELFVGRDPNQQSEIKNGGELSSRYYLLFHVSTESLLQVKMVALSFNY